MATIKLTQDFKEFLELLNSEKIEYLLIDGYAVGLYGYVRGTKDMDVWVALETENLERLINALVKFGFSRSSLSADQFTREHSVFRMGVPPNRLEILTRISGVEFRDCYARRESVEIDGVMISLIAYDDLKKNKLSTGRGNDQGDIQAIEKYRQRNK